MWLWRATILMGAAITLATPAGAYCPDARSLGEKPEEAAEYIRDNSDLVGIAYVETRRGVDVAEVLKPVVVVQGPAVTNVTMINRRQKDGSLVVSSAGGATLGVESGGLAFAALKKGDRGWFVPQCVASVLVALRRAGNEEAALQELFGIVNLGGQTAKVTSKGEAAAGGARR